MHKLLKVNDEKKVLASLRQKKSEGKNVLLTVNLKLFIVFQSNSLLFHGTEIFGCSSLYMYFQIK